MKLKNSTLHKSATTASINLNSFSSQSNYLESGQYKSPTKYYTDCKQSFFNEKNFKKNILARNQSSSVLIKQNSKNYFKSTAYCPQDYQKTNLSSNLSVEMNEKNLKKNNVLFPNKIHYLSSNKLHTSWIESNHNNYYQNNNKSNIQSPSFKDSSKNKSLLISKSDIYEHKNAKKQQDQLKKLKNQSIKRLQNKLNKYVQLIQNIKKQAQEDPKTWRKIYQAQYETKQVNPQKYKEKKIDFKPIKINKKEQLKTQSQTPISSPVFSRQNSVKNNKSIKINIKNTQKQQKNQKHLQKIEQQKQISLNDFLTINKIGQGRLGEIMIVLHKETNTIYAMKKIKKSTIKQNKLQQQLFKQIKVQASLNHPNIVNLYGFFDDSLYVYLIMEYCQQGSLDEKMTKRKYHQKGTQLLSEKETSKCLKDVLYGLNKMHSKQIMHRDIKPANIVISYGVYKICDFGWATPNPDKERRTTYCGTFDYAPPQIFKGETYDLQVDLWELGVMVYQMATGKLPFYKPCQKETLKNVINYSNELSFPKDLNLSEDIKQFILDLLQKNPEDRIPTNLLLRHPFIVSIQKQEFQK